MARRPGQGGRGPLRSAVARGGAFFLRPLHTALPSKNARRASAAAAMARKAWTDDEPRGPSRLRRLAAHAGGALHEALCSIQRALSLTLQGALDFVRRLFRQRRHCRGQGAGRQPPPPQQPPLPPLRGGAWLHDHRARARPRRAAGASSTTTTTTTTTQASSSTTTLARTFTVDGVEVPQGVVKDYVRFCSMASTCSARCTVCHFCVFEERMSDNYIVRTSTMFLHCGKRHGHEGVRCGEPGCSVRVRAGPDQALHSHFCHRLSPDWWKDY